VPSKPRIAVRFLSPTRFYPAHHLALLDKFDARWLMHVSATPCITPHPINSIACPEGASYNTTPARLLMPFTFRPLGNYEFP